MEFIVQLRQMMAEQKFADVQKLIEVQLTAGVEARHELLLLYFEALQAQEKKLTNDLALELAQLESKSKHHDFALKLVSDLDHEKYFSRTIRLKIAAAEDKGQIDLLHSFLSQYLIHQFEKQVPYIGEWAKGPIDKYFKQDFNLKLKVLAVTLLLEDNETCELLVKELVLSTIEKSSPKGILAKLNSIGEVLHSCQNKGRLEIYQNLCRVFVDGIGEATEYKRLVEMVIFFEDFKFQVLLLGLMDQLGLKDEASDYASAIRSNKNYNFVYLDKFYPHLKTYFLAAPIDKAGETQEEEAVLDLEVTDHYRSEVISPAREIEETEGEEKFLHLLKFQNYSSEQLCDLAVSFLQSEMPKVALRASELAIKSSVDDKGYLKGSYLKLTCHLQLRDYRAALDTCLDALNRATSMDDILSFLYGQAEIYIRLNQRREAKTILSKILAIDSKYRMAKERLDKLNEV